ncbi:hypothetical protein FSP39_008856 [Pinctada imbricata]|uniref:Chitin-binding type-4 domain-containing protein n=1 Tax=Pinctada imbricata TaxID=66713 RepID=A0AA89BW11_PINIB|nr:hypothetical protein FSP39_008856 [Pinctada imbricata]
MGFTATDAIEARALMIEPPQRSSLWRFRFGTPINIEDNQQNCGGYEVQWTQNEGKCGVCGDPYTGPLTHDDNGIYASGIVSRSFIQGGFVNVTVEILSNLLGYFEFRLCPRNSTDQKLTQECFDKHTLWIEESWDTRYFVGSRGGIYDLHGIGTGGINKCACMGCGQQEQFFNCADIEIRSRLQNDTFYERTRPNLHEPLFMLPPSASNISDSDVQRLQQFIAAFPDPKGMEMPVQFNFMSQDPFPFDKTLSTGDKPREIVPVGMGAPSFLDKLFMNFGSETKPIRPLPKIRGINVDFEKPKETPTATETTSYSQRRETTTKASTTFRPTFIPPPVIVPKERPPPPISIVPFGVYSTTTEATPPTLKRLGIPIQMTDMYDIVTPSADSGQMGSAMTIPLFSAFSASSDNGSSQSKEECKPSSPTFRCRGKGQYLNTEGIDKWCVMNCRTGNCATFMCECDCGKIRVKEKSCHAIGTFESIPGMDEWCTNVCAGDNCPSNVCNVEKCRRSLAR